MKRITAFLLLLAVLCTAGCTITDNDAVQPYKSESATISDNSVQRKELSLCEKLKDIAGGKDYPGETADYPFSEDDVREDEAERIYTDAAESVFSDYMGSEVNIICNTSPHKMITTGEMTSMWTVDGFIGIDCGGQESECFFGADIDMETGRIYSVNFSTETTFHGDIHTFARQLLDMTQGEATGEYDLMNIPSEKKLGVRMLCEDGLLWRVYLHYSGGKMYGYAGFLFQNSLLQNSLPISRDELLPCTGTDYIADASDDFDTGAVQSLKEAKTKLEKAVSSLAKKSPYKELFSGEYDITDSREIITGFSDGKYKAAYILTVLFDSGTSAMFQLNAHTGTLYRICGTCGDNIGADKLLSGFLSLAGTKAGEDRVTFYRNDFSAVYVYAKDGTAYYAGQSADGAFSVGVYENPLWM